MVQASLNFNQLLKVVPVHMSKGETFGAMGSGQQRSALSELWLAQPSRS